MINTLILRSFATTSLLSRKNTTSTQSSSYGVQTLKDFLLNSKESTTPTRIWSKPSRLTILKCLPPLFLHWQLYMRTASSSMDLPKIPSLRGSRNLLSQDSSSEMTSSQARQSSKLLSLISSPVLVSSLSPVFPTIIWETTTGRIWTLKNSSSQRKPPSQNASRIFWITLCSSIPDTQKNILITLLSSNTCPMLETQRKLSINTAVKSSWEVNIPSSATTFAKTVSLRQALLSILSSSANLWPGSPTRGTVMIGTRWKEWSVSSATWPKLPSQRDPSSTLSLGREPASRISSESSWAFPWKTIFFSVTDSDFYLLIYSCSYKYKLILQSFKADSKIEILYPREFIFHLLFIDLSGCLEAVHVLDCNCG